MSRYRILIIAVVTMLVLSFLPSEVFGAVAVPKPKARRFLDKPENLPKAPPELSKEEKKLLEKFGPKKIKDNKKIVAPKPTAKPKPLASPEPSATPAPVAVKKPSYTCFILVVLFLVLLIAGIISAPTIIKKIVEHRRHNF